MKPLQKVTEPGNRVLQGLINLDALRRIMKLMATSIRLLVIIPTAHLMSKHKKVLAIPAYKSMTARIIQTLAKAPPLHCCSLKLHCRMCDLLCRI